MARLSACYNVRLDVQLLEPLSWPIAILLVVFTLRRCIMVVAAALPARNRTSQSDPTVAAIVAARNEEEHLPGLVEAFERLDYPPGKISFVFVNDGSRDATAKILESWVAARSNARYVELAESVGKAQALNQALRAAPEAELVAVYDADLRPRADSLRILASVFHDPRVGAAAGYRRPSNAERSPIAAYGALESLVHQLVTQAGKERLGLNPTTLGGNCAYRRSALLRVGGFPPGSLSEDIEVSLALVAAGWRTRFCRTAVAESTMVESLRRYWNQRSRWTRGIYRSARRASHLESWLVSTGYFDRLVFLVAVAVAASGHMGFGWPALYLLGPMFAVCTALYRASMSKKLTAYVLFWSFPMFAVDITVTLASTVNAVFRRQVEWHPGGTTV